MNSFPSNSQSGAIERRGFLKGLAVAGLMASAGDGSSAESLKQDIPYRALGRTGERISAIGMGGFHLAQPGLEEADSLRLIRTAVDRGINFMDNSWDYNEGQSEIRMGKALKDGYRQKVFLMTKLDGRTKQEAAKQIDESLKRLQTDHVDLMQHHEIIRFEDPDRIFAKQGAQEAVLEAKKAGKVRYIGFTGHKDPHIHLYMLKVAADNGFKFDTVQMPLNVMDAHFRSFEKLVLPKLVEQGIGVLGMKSMGDKIILKSKTVQPIECLHYALNLPTSVVITGIDSMRILEQALEAARTFRPLSKDQVAALLAKTAQAAANGDYELFKTSQHFDSTAHHPEWLGGQSPHVDELAGPAA
ncbi:MAG TPA: aldo/keto reductase [Terriglobales bacterium]|jgi:aryl-alcohol dehydrogenase-like predicted oxidoreductase|nr:aldo/keto reductase [Terriglobales bacterium]